MPHPHAIPVRITADDMAEAFGVPLRQRSRTPVLTMARRLLAEGWHPGAMVQAYTREGTPSVYGRLGVLAALTVAESGGRERFVRWVPNPHAVAVEKEVA